MAVHNANKKVIHIRPDSKGRITLGKLAKGVSSFSLTERQEGGYILVPFVEIPAAEKWLFDNKKVLSSVKKGLKQSTKGEVIDRGSFANFVNEEDDE